METLPLYTLVHVCKTGRVLHWWSCRPIPRRRRHGGPEGGCLAPSGARSYPDGSQALGADRRACPRAHAPPDPHLRQRTHPQKLRRLAVRDRSGARHAHGRGPAPIRLPMPTRRCPATADGCILGLAHGAETKHAPAVAFGILASPGIRRRGRERGDAVACFPSRRRPFRPQGGSIRSQRRRYGMRGSRGGGAKPRADGESPCTTQSHGSRLRRR